jgi:hypothetical protein
MEKLYLVSADDMKACTARQGEARRGEATDKTYNLRLREDSWCLLVISVFILESCSSSLRALLALKSN